MKYDLITVLGPTAVGKTKLAALLADRFNGEIISADSRQVYKGMDIGTGKDLQDYVVNGSLIPYHLIDIIEPSEEFNVFRFRKLFYETFKQITGRNKIPFLVGGTGLYLNAVLSNYNLKEIDFNKKRINELNKLPVIELTEILKSLNPKLHNTTDLKIKNRVIKAIIVAEQSTNSQSNEYPKLNPLIIGIKLERELIKRNITNRLKNRLKNGMVEEVENLMANGITLEKLMFFGLEYKYVSLYLSGKLNYNDMFQKLNSAIHKFAKRQMTWFRKMERSGIKINWIEGPDFESAGKIISKEFFDEN